MGLLNDQIHYGYTASAIDSTHGFRLLRITDIQDNKVSWQTVPGCNINPYEAYKYVLHENDILIARTGGTIGKSYQVKNLTVNSIFASYLIRLVPHKLLIPEYIKLFVETPLYWDQLFEKSMGTGQPNVNATSLKDLKTPLPPLLEQKAIVNKIDQLLILCHDLEDQVNESKEKVEILMRALTNEVLLNN